MKNSNLVSARSLSAPYANGGKGLGQQGRKTGLANGLLLRIREKEKKGECRSRGAFYIAKVPAVRYSHHWISLVSRP